MYRSVCTILLCAHLAPCHESRRDNGFQWSLVPLRLLQTTHPASTYELLDYRPRETLVARKHLKVLQKPSLQFKPYLTDCYTYFCYPSSCSPYGHAPGSVTSEECRRSLQHKQHGRNYPVGLGHSHPMEKC